MIAIRHAAFALSLALSSTSVCWAFPEFPSEIRAAGDLDCTPSCTVCHVVDPGEKGTATKEFARAMIGADVGVISGDAAAIQDAWDGLGGVDSDGDGVTDTEELSADVPSDPNDSNLTPSNPGDGVCAAEVRYGCGAQTADIARPASKTGWAMIIALLGVAWMAARRRTRGSAS